MIGQVIAERYHVERALGEGGAAQVFLARDGTRGGHVAMKFFPSLRSSEEEFRREAAAAMRGKHRNVVSLVDAGVSDGAPWLALEFVDGMDARTLLESRIPSIEEAVDIVIQVFSALDSMHRSGIAHGDIKPENILLEKNLARVVDFGRARFHHLIDGRGMFPGTPPYMHPSLFHGGLPTARTDCFATWVMMSELIVGERPWTVGALRWAHGDMLPAREPIYDEAMERLIHAGLSGYLPDARSGWLALSRYRRGRTDVPLPPPRVPPPPPDIVEKVVDRLRDGRCVAVTGDIEYSRGFLHAAHRQWEGYVLWASADWGSPAVPLSGALGLAAHAAEGFDGTSLLRIAEHLGPLAGVIGAASPAARAWLGAENRPMARPPAERLALALRRFLAACPRPLLVLVDGMDRLDGSSRRFLSTLVSTGDLRILGTAGAGRPHGLPQTYELEEITLQEATSSAPSDVVLRARVLALPLGEKLARAGAFDPQRFEDAVLDAEAAREASWNGAEVVARPGPLPPADLAQKWLRDAAARLDEHRDAVLIARYAMQSGDDARLAAVIDRAIAEVERVDPVDALDIAARDPRPPTPAGVIRHLHIAVAARDIALAETLITRLQAVGGSAADIAEAEAEVAFRQGRDTDALAAYLRLAKELGAPLRGGIAGFLGDIGAILAILGRRAVSPAPDPRRAMCFERLYDLYFSRDHRSLIRIHRRWLAAAPSQARARAMDVIWQTALGRHDVARGIETALAGELREDTDPHGAAVVLMHRSIARGLRGETVESFTDGVDATERLLRVGDPYLAALAMTSVSTSGTHLAAPATMSRIFADVRRLATDIGDSRSALWCDGAEAGVAWLVGDKQGAAQGFAAWADAAAARNDMAEAVAARLAADVAVENGDLVAALRWVERCETVIRRCRLQLDFTDAIAIARVMATGKGEKALNRLVSRSPRWGARALVARASAAVHRGDTLGARRLFGAAVGEAESRQQIHDLWFAWSQRARLLDDATAADAAAAIAIQHGIKMGTAGVRR